MSFFQKQTSTLDSIKSIILSDELVNRLIVDKILSPDKKITYQEIPHIFQSICQLLNQQYRFLYDIDIAIRRTDVGRQLDIPVYDRVCQILECIKNIEVLARSKEEYDQSHLRLQELPSWVQYCSHERKILEHTLTLISNQIQRNKPHDRTALYDDLQELISQYSQQIKIFEDRISKSKQKLNRFIDYILHELATTQSFPLVEQLQEQAKGTPKTYSEKDLSNLVDVIKQLVTNYRNPARQQMFPQTETGTLFHSIPEPVTKPQFAPVVPIASSRIASDEKTSLENWEGNAVDVQVQLSQLRAELKTHVDTINTLNSEVVVLNQKLSDSEKHSLEIENSSLKDTLSLQEEIRKNEELSRKLEELKESLKIEHATQVEKLKLSHKNELQAHDKGYGEKYQALHLKYQSKVDELEKEAKIQVDDLELKLDSLSAHNTKLEQDFSTSSERNNQLEGTVAAKVLELCGLEGNYKSLAEQYKTLETHKTILEQNLVEKEELRVKTELKSSEDLEDLKTQHSREISGVKTKHANETEAKNQEHLLAVANLKKRHQQESTSALKNFQSKMAEVIKEHTTEVDRLKHKSIQEQKDHASKMDELKKGFADERAKIQSAIKSREAAWEKEKKGLALFVQNQQRQFLQKKGVQGLLDTELLAGSKPHQYIGLTRFTNILLDPITDWEWHSSPPNWPPQIFQVREANEARLKAAILKDFIWCFLFERIFCSPFRSMGEIGADFEKQWNATPPKGFGQDEKFQNIYYTWPAATTDSEQYRYETCQAALKTFSRPTSEIQEGMKLIRSYSKNQADICNKLIEMIETFVEVDEGRKQQIKQLVQQASSLWLILCTQRMRLFFSIPAESVSATLTDKPRLAKARKLKLVAHPGLTRYGDDVGFELTKEIFEVKDVEMVDYFWKDR